MKFSQIPHRVHFVGIGGVGMSALAQHLHKLGYRVTGSDRQQNDRTDALTALGINVRFGHAAENVRDTQLVVRTSAVHPDNPEIVQAEKEKIPVVLREELLGAVFNSFAVRIAVCGTHGKTTTTAMLHSVLEAAGVSHAAFIGGVFHGSNYFFGKNVVVAEACEYNRSFLNLRPTVTVVLNAEFDHPDCYKNLADVRSAFKQFIGNTEKGGVVILPYSLRKLCKNKRCVYFDYGVASDVSLLRGKPSFCVTANKMTARVKLNVVGEHNVCNALAVIAAASEVGVSLSQALNALSAFDGVDRRWTELQGACKIVIDYAHHPTEIACAIEAAKSVSKGKVICIFQPHTYSRTKAFFKQFATCFSRADKVAYLPVYSAREKPIPNVNSSRLAQKAKELGVDARFAQNFQQAKEWALNNVSPNDVLLILGAGDVVRLAELLR